MGCICFSFFFFFLFSPGGGARESFSSFFLPSPFLFFFFRCERLQKYLPKISVNASLARPPFPSFFFFFLRREEKSGLRLPQDASFITFFSSLFLSQCWKKCKQLAYGRSELKDHQPPPPLLLFPPFKGRGWEEEEAGFACCHLSLLSPSLLSFLGGEVRFGTTLLLKLPLIPFFLLRRWRWLGHFDQIDAGLSPSPSFLLSGKANVRKQVGFTAPSPSPFLPFLFSCIDNGDSPGQCSFFLLFLVKVNRNETR